MPDKKPMPATDSARDLHDLVGDDATAEFENDPKFGNSDPTASASSESLASMRDTDDDEESDDELEDEDDEDEEDDEDYDDEDEELEDDEDEEEEEEDEELAASHPDTLVLKRVA